MGRGGTSTTPCSSPKFSHRSPRHTAAREVDLHPSITAEPPTPKIKSTWRSRHSLAARCTCSYRGQKGPIAYSVVCFPLRRRMSRTSSTAWDR